MTFGARWGGGEPQAPATSTPGNDPVPILQEAGWAPGPVWTGRKSRPYGDSIPDHPAPSQSLYRLNYPAHSTSVSKWITQDNETLLPNWHKESW